MLKFKRLEKEEAAHIAAFSFISIIILLNSKSIISHIFSIVAETLILTCYGNINLKMIFKKMRLPILYAVLSVLPLFLSVSFTPFSVSIQSSRESLIILFRILSTVYWLVFLGINVKLSELSELFLKMHVPLFLIEIMELTVRFIQMVSETAAEMVISMQSRNGFVGFSRTLKSIGIIVSNLFIKSYFRVKEVSLAMESREYGSFKKIKNKETDIIFVVLSSLTIITMLFLAVR